MKLKNLFQTFGIKNVAAYYLAGFFSSCFFMQGNWLLFYERVITRQQMGTIAVISTIAGILFEIPTGALADLLGKKRVILIGMFLPALCYIVALTFESFFGFLASETLVVVSFAFLSGSLEAFAYDSLVEHKKVEHFNHVESRRRIFQSLALMISPAIGGYLYTINIRLPWFFGIATFSLGTLFFSLLAKEPSVDTYTFSFKEYWKQLGRGVKELFSEKTRDFIVPMFTFSIIMYLTINVVKQALGQYLGFGGDTLGYMFSVVSACAIVVGLLFPRIQKKLGIKKSYLVSYFIYITALSLASVGKSNILLGIIVLLTLYPVSEFTQPLGSLVLNKAISSKVRATTLSTLSMLAQIPYVVLFLLFANMTLKENMSSLLQILAGFIGLSFFVYLIHLLLIKEEEKTVA